MSFAALVFDMDGTLVDNMAVHREVWRVFGRRQGWNVDDPHYDAKVGHGNMSDLLSRVLGRPATAAEIAELGGAKESLYREVYGPQMCAVAGLHELLAVARRSAKRVALCTNADRPNADFVLDGLAIREYFEVAVYGADVAVGKPDPACYRLATQRLGLPGSACVAFEDTPQGVTAARGAGLTTVAVTTSYGVDQLGMADLIVADFRDRRLAQLL